MKKTYYTLFNVSDKKYSIDTRIENTIEYFDKIAIEIKAPEPLSIKQNETTIIQAGNKTMINVFFKGGDSRNRLAVLKANRKKKQLLKDVSNMQLPVTKVVEFNCLWNEYDNSPMAKSAVASETDSNADEGSGKSVLVDD